MEERESTHVQKPLNKRDWLEYVKNKLEKYNESRIKKVVIISDKKIMSWYINGKGQEIEFIEMENGFTEIKITAIITQ